MAEEAPGMARGGRLATISAINDNDKCHHTYRMEGLPLTCNYFSFATYNISQKIYFEDKTYQAQIAQISLYI